MAAWRRRAPAVTVRERRSRSDRRAPGSSDRAKRAILRPEPRVPESLLDLQRHAGNAAVAGLIQRAPLAEADDPKGYTAAGGVKNVEASAMTRREVHGLKFGVQGGFQSTYTSKRWDKATKKWKEKVRTSAEAKMTKESPDNMAVVVMPDTVDKDRPVQVILHFHGWGFRGGTDPYAGYLVASGEEGGAPGSARGTVRDVDQEHWAQQIGAVNKERATAGGGPQTIAVLAQGRGMSDFGNVPTFDYVQDVLSRVPELKAVSQYSIVLSGHSGGGGTQVANKVSADARTRDRSKLPAATPGSAAAQPADLVVLFDAEGIESVGTWAVDQIAMLNRAIRAAATPAAAQDALAATPKFRGYFAKGGAYADRYAAVNNKLVRAFRALPAVWTQRDPADPKAVKVPDLFRIVEMSGVGHESVISGGKDGPAQQGALADSLRVSSDPTVDRDRALGASKMKAPPIPTTTPPTRPRRGSRRPSRP